MNESQIISLTMSFVVMAIITLALRDWIPFSAWIVAAVVYVIRCKYKNQ